MSQGPHHNYMISAVALDFGQTLIDERVDILLEDTYHEQHLMPGVREALTGLAHPVAIWANTRRANAEDVWRWLQRAGLAAHVAGGRGAGGHTRVRQGARDGRAETDDGTILKS